MPRELKNIRVDFISLVKAGANGKVIILKNSDKTPVFDKVIKIKKTVEGVAYGIVYAPDEVDAQGDFARADEIKKAAYEFMKNLSGRNVDKNHSFEKQNAYIAESWLVRKGDPVFEKEKDGAWAVGIKLEDDKLIEGIKKGEIKGLSMAGQAETVKKGDDSTGLIKGLADAIRSAFAKADDKNTGDEDMTELKKTLEEGFTTISDKIKKVSDAVDTMGKRVDMVETAMKKSAQDKDAFEKSEVDGIV